METITLNATENSSRNPQLHVAAAGGLDTDHHHSPVDEEQMLNLSDITDLTQDDIVQVPKEMVLISLVSQEQALYNPKHENYRNTHRKDVKWLEIAECVGWTDTQCKAKWKAMRDQYCRELKRSKFNIKANVKWKYFKELDFLRPYALARNYRPRNPSNNPPSISTSYNCSPTTNNNNNLTSNENNSTKFTTTIKIESNAQAFGSCEFVPTKTEDSTTLTEEQLNSVLQQQNHQQTDDNNWSYLTGSTSSSNTATRLDNHSLNDSHMLQTHSQQQTDEALINALVDCVGQIHQQQMCQQQPTINQQSPDEEDDDPIHTFLNIESYFEKELISLIHFEDVLYNSYNPNYRNVKLKLEVWDVIARKLKKSVKQCRLKWKALRDQFIREHKRLKNRENIESLPRWKHYDALSFLQKYIKHKTNDFGNKSLTQMPKTEMEPEMDVEDDHINMGGDSSPLRSPLAIKCELPQLQAHNPSSQQLQMGSLSAGAVQHQQHSNQSDNLCVSAGGYDDMDIDDYIIGDSSSVVDDGHHDKGNNGANLEQTAHSEKHKFQSDFGLYDNHGNQRGTTTTTTTTDASSKQQQSQQDLQPQQHISMPSLDLNDSSASSMIGAKTIKTHNAIASNNSNNNNNNNNTTTSFNGALSNHVTGSITNGNTLTLNAPTNICATTSAISVNNQPNTTETGTNTTPPSALSPSILPINQSTASNATITNSGEDDEVGAFFKAVAMKIRNAKMSPVAFTDLQINILHVINDTLRNH